MKQELNQFLNDKKQPIKRVAIYARVSITEQAEGGYSVDIDTCNDKFKDE